MFTQEKHGKNSIVAQNHGEKTRSQLFQPMDFSQKKNVVRGALRSTKAMLERMGHGEVFQEECEELGIAGRGDLPQPLPKKRSKAILKVVIHCCSTKYLTYSQCDYPKFERSLIISTLFKHV